MKFSLKSEKACVFWFGLKVIRLNMSWTCYSEDSLPDVMSVITPADSFARDKIILDVCPHSQNAVTSRTFINVYSFKAWLILNKQANNSLQNFICKIKTINNFPYMHNYVLVYNNLTKTCWSLCLVKIW